MNDTNKNKESKNLAGVTTTSMRKTPTIPPKPTNSYIWTNFVDSFFEFLEFIADGDINDERKF
jgi:hypothetical protein